MLYRLQEWLADRFGWAQYPAEKRTQGLHWKYAMPAEQRFFLACMSLLLLLISGGLMLAVIWIISTFVWAAFTS